jgi:hypothetical protein
LLQNEYILYIYLIANIKEVGTTNDNQPIDVDKKMEYIEAFIYLLIRLKEILDPKYKNSILFYNYSFSLETRNDNIIRIKKEKTEINVSNSKIQSDFENFLSDSEYIRWRKKPEKNILNKHHFTWTSK